MGALVLQLSPPEWWSCFRRYTAKRIYSKLYGTDEKLNMRNRMRTVVQRHMSCFRKKNDAYEETSIMKTGTKKILRRCTFPVHLLVRSEHSQWLRFPDHTFFALCSKITRQVLLYCFLQFQGAVAALHRMLFEWVHGVHSAWGNSQRKVIAKWN